MKKFQFPLHRDPRCNLATAGGVVPGQGFQFPLHRDPRCNCKILPSGGRACWWFQFPLHRDPRCNAMQGMYNAGTAGFSSLYIGILAATHLEIEGVAIQYVSVPFTSGSSLQPRSPQSSQRDLSSFSSLYIGILAATRFFPALQDLGLCFSSLYIGILAATTRARYLMKNYIVSVPFTSGSSLQQGPFRHYECR